MNTTTVEKAGNGESTTMRRRFAGAAAAFVAGTALLGAAAPAQAQTHSDIGRTADYLSARGDNYEYLRNGQTISQHYVNLHTFFLQFPGKGDTRGMSLVSDINLLARSYGVSASGLISAINMHSNDAYEYHRGIGRGRSYLYDANQPGLVLLKAQALENVGRAYTSFLESVYTRIEANGGHSNEDTYAAFGRMCTLEKTVIEQYGRLNLPGVRADRSAFILNAPNGAYLNCPQPRGNGGYQPQYDNINGTQMDPGYLLDRQNGPFARQPQPQPQPRIYLFRDDYFRDYDRHRDYRRHDDHRHRDDHRRHDDRHHHYRR